MQREEEEKCEIKEFNDTKNLNLWRYRKLLRLNVEIMVDAVAGALFLYSYSWSI